MASQSSATPSSGANAPPALNKVPRATAFVVSLIAVLSLGSIYSEDFRQHFVLIPANTLLGEHTFWNLVTGSLVELGIIKLGFVGAYVVVFGSQVERLMGWPKYLGMLTAVTFVCGVLTSFAAFMQYVTTQVEELFYGQIYGGLGVCVTLAVSLAQLAPETKLPFFPQFTNANLPLLTLGIGIVSELILESNHDIAFTIIGFIGSWTYLRFFQPQSDGSFGDRRSEFEFVCLLPAPIRPAVRPLTKAIGSVVLKLSIFHLDATSFSMPSPTRDSKPRRAPADTSGAAAVRAPRADGQPIVDPVAERRRARALKALDQKLADMKRSAGGGPKARSTAASEKASAKASTTVTATARAPAAAGPSTPTRASTAKPVNAPGAPMAAKPAESAV